MGETRATRNVLVSCQSGSGCGKAGSRRDSFHRLLATVSADEVDAPRIGPALFYRRIDVFDTEVVLPEYGGRSFADLPQMVRCADAKGTGTFGLTGSWMVEKQPLFIDALAGVFVSPGCGQIPFSSLCRRALQKIIAQFLHNGCSVTRITPVAAHRKGIYEWQYTR